jgi:hypothetical protein
MIPALIATGLILAAAPAAAPPRPTAAQKAQVKALTEKLGACHRARAAAGAETEASAEEIVSSTLAACQSRVAPIRAAMAKAIGGEAADAAIAAQKPKWEDSIRRIVSVARGSHHGQ